MKYLFWSFFILVIVLSSCKKETTTIDFGQEYFGWDEGNFVTYDVVEITHDINLEPASDTFRYTLKTVVGEPILDNEGRNANKFYRYAYSEEGALLDSRVWTGILTDGRAEIVEENQRIIHLVFAVTEDKTWNRNAFNPAKQEIVSYQGIDQERTIGTQTFDSSVRVNIQDFFSLVDHRVKYDTYAKGVGLVHRYVKDLTISNFDTLNIQSGKEVYYSIVDFGKEELED